MESLEQAFLERDTKVVNFVHRSFMVEQTARHHQLEHYTADVRLHLKQAEFDAAMAIENATGVLSAEHAAEHECALKAQK